MPQDIAFDILQPGDPVPEAFRNISGRYEAMIELDEEGRLTNRSMILRIDLEGENKTCSISGDLFNVGPPARHWRSFRATSLIHQRLGDDADAPHGRDVLRCPLKLYRSGDDVADIEDFNVGRLDLFSGDDGLVAVYTHYAVETALQASRRTAMTPETYRLGERDPMFRHATVRVLSCTSVEPDRPRLFESEGAEGPETVEAAFASAGIRLDCRIEDELIDDTGGTDDLDNVWTDAELHSALIDTPGTESRIDWSVNLLFASRYMTDQRKVTGIMFDTGKDDKRSRQGAAVFCDAINSLGLSEERERREYWFTTVHELGHTFNLLHSFQKDRAAGMSALPRPSALSWMNYPKYYPYGLAYPALGADGTWDGRAAFWAEVDRCQGRNQSCFFDLEELIHLRHSDRMGIIMGGRWAASKPEEAELVDGAVAPFSASGVELTVTLPDQLDPLEQLEGYVRLKNCSDHPIEVPANLLPGDEAMEILIQKPNESYARRFTPVACTCSGGATERLEPGGERYAAISLSYGHRWWYVDDVPGAYKVQAVCHMPDGSIARSKVVSVWVPDIRPSLDRSKLNQFFQSDIGLFIALGGSRCRELSAARDWFCELHDQLNARDSKTFRQFLGQAGLRLGLVGARVFKRPGGASPECSSDADRREGAMRIENALNARDWLGDPRGRNKPKNPFHVQAAAAAVHAYKKVGDGERALALSNRLFRLLTDSRAPDSVADNLAEKLGSHQAK